MENVATTLQETQVLPLTNLDIVRAWKDAGYRRTLSASQLQVLPENPAGQATLTGAELKVACGLEDEEGRILTTALTCTEWTFRNWKACGC